MAKIFEEIYKSIVKKGLDNLVDATPQTTSTESNKVENKLKSGPISQTSINPVLNRNQKSLLDPINYVKNNLDTLKKTADIIGMASKQNVKAREEVGLKSPAHEIAEPINNAVTSVLNKLAEDNKSLNKVQQEHLDASSSAYLDTNDIIQKIKNDRTYYNNLFDNDGNLKDYSSEIIRLQEVASNQFGSEDRKAAKQQLDLYKQYQSEQKKLVYASQYQELVNNGADNDTLNKFKEAVIKDNYNAAERVLADFGSTVQSFAGSLLNATNTLTATVSKLYGGEPTMSDYPSRIIQEAEDLQSIIMNNANGAEQVAYKVYNGMAPFLYSLLLGGMTSQSFLGNQAAAQALTNRALLINDVSVLGQKMKDNMANGYDFNTSVLNASLHAMLSHITESIGGESIANILTGDIGVHLLDNYLNYTCRALANPFISEMIEEGTEAAIEPIIDSLTLNTGLTVEDYINQVFSKDTLEQMLIGGLGGLVMGAGSTFKTIYEFDSGVKKLADTIDISDSKDYTSAKEANEFFKSLIQETQDKLATGQIAEDKINETTNQLFVMKELQKSYATKISEYETMNPYANAFISPEDTTSKLSGDAQQEVMKAAAPTLKQNIDDIVNAKQNFIQKNKELNSKMQQELANKGISINASEYNSLSEEAKKQVDLTSKYSKRLKSDVVFANMVSKNGEIVDGLFVPEIGKMVINPNAKTGALTAYVHELTHNTESSTFYSLLKMLIKDTYGDAYQESIKQLQEQYSDLTNLNEEQAERELVAITTQSLLNNEQFLDRLVRYNTSLAYQMYEEIKYINQTTGSALDAIEQNFMRALSTTNSTNNKSGVSQMLFMGNVALKNLKKGYKEAYGYVKSNYDMAKKMEGEYSADKIFAKTSFFRDPTGEWKFEVLEDYDYITNHFPTENGSYLLKDIYGPNSYIFKFYPELANMEVIKDDAKGSNGAYSPRKKRIYLHSSATPGTIIHEVQHYIQTAEGFITGTSPEIVKKELEKEAIINKLVGMFTFNKKLQNIARQQYEDSKNEDYLFAAYENSPGEVEARNASDRSIMLSEGNNIDNIIPAMIDKNVVSEIKKYYDLGDEKSITSIIKDIIGNLHFDMYSYISGNNNLLQDKHLVYEKIRDDGIELSKGITLEDLGRTKDLIAAHNLSEDKLLASINLGGFVMPSIAVTKDTVSHDGFGPITLLFDKNTIDPSNKLNKVYSQDAWTPIFPQIETEIIRSEVDKVRNHLYDLSRKVDQNYAGTVRNFTNKYFDSVATTDTLENVIDKLRNDLSMKAAYLEENGIHIPVGVTYEDKYSERNKREYEKILSIIPSFNYSEEELLDMYGDQIGDIIYQRYIEDGKTEEMANKYARANFIRSSMIEKALTYKYDIENGRDKTKKVDYSGAADRINRTINEEEYLKWGKELFSPMFGKKGIWNGKEYITGSGNRRTFKQMYNDVTIDNVLKDMLSQNPRGGTFNKIGFNNVRAMLSNEYKSLKDIYEDEFRLTDGFFLDNEEVKKLSDRYFNLTNQMISQYKYIGDYGVERMLGFDRSLEEALTEISKKPFTVENILNALRNNNINATEEMAEEFYSIFEEGKKTPTDYFEAKPRRIIGLDEIQTAIIPNNSSDYLKETLRNDGINYIEYDPNIEGDRQQKIKAQDNLKFSKGITLEELKANTKTSSEQKILKSFFKEKFGANLRRTSLGIDSLLNLYTYEVINNGEVSESTYNRLKEAVWESSKVRRGNNAYDPSELRRYLKNNPILVTQLEYRDSDTIRNNFGSIGFSKNGNSFDKVMMEFDSLYPGLIDTENIKTATEFVDAVSNVIDTLESQKNGYFVPDLENMTSEQELKENFDEKFNGAMKIYEEEIIKNKVVENIEKNADDVWRENTQSVLDKVNANLEEELTVENIDSILKHKNINPRTIESIESTKDVMIENADKWIKGYDTLREEFPLYSKETFSNALYEILIYGDIKPETYDKMANSLSSDYDYENIVVPDFENDINKFINEAIITFTNESKYKAGEIDLDPIKKAMTLNEAYNGQTIDDDTKRFVNNSRLNETTSKFKKQIKEGWQDTVNELLEFNKVKKEETGKDISSRISRFKTIDQNLDALASGNVDLRDKLKKQIRYDLLDEAAKVKYEVLSNANELVNKITDLGIVEGSKENVALQYILEKHTNVVRSDLNLGADTTKETIDEFYRNPYEAYTEEDLKKEFNYKMANDKYAWENILSAAELIKESYDDVYKEIFESQILANGDVEGNMDLKLAEAKTKVEEAYKVMDNIKAEIKKNGSKESTQSAYEMAKAKFNRLVNQYNALVTRDERGDSTRRQLTPYRENFSHHIVKRSVKSDIESIKDAGLMTPTQLAGISEQTKPNTMWASFSAAQDSLDYEPNALASYTEYMKEAANVISYNPVILSLRQLTSDIQATAQNRELNKFAEYLTDYTNMLSGKRLGIDREVQKFVGDKGMKIISTLNKYAKAAALTGNIRSALVQFANIPSGLANLSTDVSPKELAIDIAYGIKDWINKDSGKHDLIKLSPFMNNRYFDFDTGKNGVMNSLDDFAKTMLQVGDKIGAETIWYTALNQGMRLGVPNAVKYADDITRKSIAGRTKEDMAVAMNSQVLNLLFPFQVENNNLYQNLKQYMKDGNAGAIITYGVSAYIFNAIIKAIMNSDDEILPEFVTPIVDEVTKGLKGEQGLDDTVQNALFGEIGEMISLMPVGSTILNLTLNNDKANELFGDYNPSRYGTTNIGLSGIGNVISSLDNDNNRIAFADALSDLIAGYVKGGKQFIRTTEGLQSMGGLPKLDADGNVVMTPVNYTKSGRIAYVNDQSDIPDWIRASLFGKYSTDPAREYIDSGFKTMTDKEQRIFELLNDSGTDTKEAYNTATEHTDLVNQSKEDETIDSSLRNKLIENGTYSDYMSTLTESYEKYLEDFDYENETPKTFKQFASSYGISSDDLKQDTYQGFYELYDLSEEQQKAFSEAMDIDNSVDALGKTISNSGATQRRIIYEQQGIYDDILKFIEENNLDYSDFGLTKTVVGYNSSQINAMLEKIGMESNYTTDDKTSPSEPKNTYSSGGKSSRKSRLSTQQKSLLKMYLSIINSNYSNFQKIMNSMTSVQEAKSNIEKILKNIKG